MNIFFFYKHVHLKGNAVNSIKRSKTTDVWQQDVYFIFLNFVTLLSS